MLKAMLIRIEPEKYDTLQVLAKRSGRSIANLIRFVLAEYIEAQTTPDPEPSTHWTARVYGGKRGTQ